MLPFFKDIFDQSTYNESRPLPDIWEHLYRKLNVYKDGRIDADDLRKELEEIGKDGFEGRDFEAFVKYLESQQKTIKLGFGKVAKEKTGKVGRLKVIQLMGKLRISLSILQAKEVIKHLDNNKYMDIDWNKWWQSYVTDKEDNMRNMIDVWRYNSIFSINDDITNCEEFLENEEPEKWWGHLIAGGTAGATSRTMTAPFDRLRVLMQVYSTRENKIKILSGIKQMIAEGGLSSMWKGNLTNIMKICPELAIKFMAYEELKELIAADPENLRMKERFLAGSMAGAVSQSATYPIEVLKTRMMLRRSGEPRELYTHVRNIFMYEGFSTFFRGYVPNIMGLIPYAGIDLAMYETLKNLWIQTYTTGNERPNILLVVASASASNVVGQFASYPLLVLHTQMQAEVIEKGKRKPRLREYFWNILTKDGLPGFYRGFTANMIKAIPSVCISYVTYEYMKTLLGLHSH
ncbi:calcium-binding mitochondrial carrier protein SCaMC-2-like [Hypanus sabinus]|uniref:calcium-binding mitochondrial carrier protein SCaMC-2-like n=1 Tax=Hypanus sabinus TaxID=79690 RepID=UPI0028C39DAC|nr:calcium-binding mitochondrial carrier protein SCaMC-2-like [Hypanus sabinus]